MFDLTTHIAKLFKTTYGVKPIIVRSPGRINLIGEHTDYNDGFVFPAAIDKGIILGIQKSATDVCNILALDNNEWFKFSLQNVKPQDTGSWQNYILGVVAELQKKGLKLKPFNIIFDGDIPAGAGLSSSAALENSVVFGLNELFGLGLSKKDMIFISQQAEHNFVGVRCGIMDQFASMFGQKNKALLLDCRTIEAKSYEIDFEDYQLVLINTNVKHSLSDSAYNDRRQVCEKVSDLLKIKALRDASELDLNQIKVQISEADFQKALFIIQENQRVNDAGNTIKNRDLKALGQLMYASHRGLQNQYKVSCAELDFLVAQAENHPAVIGSRMMGGGFGGCTINIVKKNQTDAFVKSTSEAYKQTFQLDCSVYYIKLSNGTHLIN